MARTKKFIKKTQLKRKVKKPPTKAVKKTARKAPKAASTAPTEAAPAVEGGKQTKTAFVLSFPPETPAKDVVSAGAAQGIALSEKGVYKTRYLARNKGAETVKKASPKAAAKAPPKAVKAAKRAPGKRGPGDGSASLFIREQPLSMKASEVVSAAKAKGISLTAGLVYSVRGQMKKAGKAAPSAPSGKRRGRPPSVAAKAATPKAVTAAVGGDRERQLISLALDIGLARAVELVQGLRSKIDTLY